jgi:hypothetical protein
MKIKKSQLRRIIKEESARLSEVEYPSDRGTSRAEEAVMMAIKDLMNGLGSIPDAFDRRMVALDAIEQIEKYANQIEQ